jgi:hypothetical protein
MEYKGSRAKLLMMGTKETVSGWKGEIFVAAIQYGDEDNVQYDVIPDSTDPADLDALPELKTFDDKGQAISHFMKLENNKSKWK